MDDLISRQMAIDEIKVIYEYHDTVTEDRIIDHLKRLPSAPGLSEEDLQEIQDRFGDFVRFVVEDMTTGEEKRWNNER